MSNKTEQNFQVNNLVLYKLQPARIIRLGAKIEIELPDKSILQVRNKDITLLHAGPLNSLDHLETISGEVSEACALLAGQTTTVAEFAELAYGRFTPSAAWAVCQLLQEGLLLYGSIEAITVRTPEEYQCEAQNRLEKSREQDAWNGFIQRIKRGEISARDKMYYDELADFAYEKSNHSRILKQLGMPVCPESAHALLLKLKYWDETVNPYVTRLGMSLAIEYPEVCATDDERLDLTHLQAFAIDDEGNTDPDDAISIDGNTLWVHVADAASLIQPNTPADIQAQSQACTLYLPEKTVFMLPPQATQKSGLGLQEISPALSFSITLNDAGAIETTAIRLSLVKVTRLTYAAAQALISEENFKKIQTLTTLYKNYRQQQQAIHLSFPQVKIRVIDGKVHITPLPILDSHEMVMNAMIMAGEAAAGFASAHEIPVPYTTQRPPESIEFPTDLAAMYSYRRKLRPSEVKLSPDQHAGLGLKTYCRVTSPLRRYLDLIAHQQLRAFLTGKPLLGEQELMNRIGASAAATALAQKLERLSNLHWTLVFLLQNPQWQGRGIVVEKSERYTMVILPDIALETKLHSSKNLPLNQEIMLRVTHIDLPGLTAHFAVI